MSELRLSNLAWSALEALDGELLEHWNEVKVHDRYDNVITYNSLQLRAFARGLTDVADHLDAVEQRKD